MRVLIFLAAWRRPEITEICFMGINRLIKAGILEIDTMCVISEESMIPICEKYGVDWCFYKNDPLGEKKNHALNCAMLKSWDYLLEIGSDDVLKTEILNLYKPHMESGLDFFGIKHFQYINSENGQCRDYKSNTTYGAARCISRKAIERVCYGVDVLAKTGLIIPGNTIQEGKKGFLPITAAQENEKLGRLEIIGEPRYRLWKDELNRSLDNNSTYFLEMNFIGHKQIHCEKALGIDIKSKDNIWAFNPDLGNKIDFDKVVEGLSDEEVSALLRIIKQNQPVETAAIW